MQKWYDDGYFQPNLLMKCIHLDQDWISVAKLLQRAANPRIFLTPLVNVPPGLPRRDPLLDGPAPDGTFGSPFQPVPARLRTTAMDSYLHNGSLAPDSPPSSFSAGRFSNGSPDPSALGNRLGGHHHTDSPVGLRLAALVGTPMEPQRRATFEESVDSNNMSSRAQFANYTPGRTGSIDGPGFHRKLHGYMLSRMPLIKHQLWIIKDPIPQVRLVPSKDTRIFLAKRPDFTLFAPHRAVR